jgi:hypothetical protein
VGDLRQGRPRAWSGGEAAGAKGAIGTGHADVLLYFGHELRLPAMHEPDELTPEVRSFL